MTDLTGIVSTMLVPLCVAIYTYNYGRWAMRNQNRRGAVGLFLLAALVLAMPGLTVWWHS